jgi:hypothetical protein
VSQTPRTTTWLGLVLFALACEPGAAKDGSIDGLGTTAAETEDADGDGITGDADCDDADPAIGPGAEEICDGVDNNCDGEVDEGVTRTFYADADADGFGDPTVTAEACEAPDGMVPNATDCDDSNDAIYPDAREVCDELDNDCDGSIDEDTGGVYYTDADGDGYGDPATEAFACAPGSDQVSDNTDCDDTDAANHPDGEEVCDEQDNDCDGDVDEGTGSTFYADTDADGWGDLSATTEACRVPAGYTETPGDCDPTDGTIYPGAAEVCDGVDQDCDGVADNGVLLTFYADTDTDGHGDLSAPVEACSAPSGHAVTSDDCDDSNSAVNPSATEVCNTIDDDCDGAIDDADGSLDLGTASTWYDDLDGDGFGDPSGASVTCIAASTAVSDNTDCDDSDATVNPSAPEVCDGQDNDCDGSGDFMDGSAAACPAADCLDVLSYSTTDGTYWIEPGTSGAYEAYCDQTTEGGGWTLAWVVSDDGQNTWTWTDRLLMSTDTSAIGSVADRTTDFKSMAAHEVLFEDLLFVHAPSGVTAEYDAVGDGTMDFGSHIDSLATLSCDFSMAGNGHPLTGGTLTLGGNLCDTDLYFNLGDHESDLAYCLNLSASYNHATYGPAWSHGNNNGCPFDDPSTHALGPANPCASCGSTTDTTESRGLGFASTLGLNTGSAGSATNRMSVFVR